METGTEMSEERAYTAPVQPTPAEPAAKKSGRRWLLGIGALVAVLALVAFAGSTLAAPPRGVGPGMMNPGMMGPNGHGMFGRGLRAVVTGVDTGANTITLGGLPTQVSTVKVDNTVKLVTLQADGTTTPAAIGDFKSGSLVRVGFSRGNGNGNAAGMQGTPGAGNRFGNGGNFAVTELALVPDNIAEVSGLVLANNNGTYTIASDGGLRLTVKTTGSTTYTKTGNQSAAAGDIKVGSRIIVSGTQAPDGITANTVRVMDFANFPMGGQMPRGRMPGANGANGTPAATVTR